MSRSGYRAHSYAVPRVADRKTPAPHLAFAAEIHRLGKSKRSRYVTHVYEVAPDHRTLSGAPPGVHGRWVGVVRKDLT